MATGGNLFGLWKNCGSAVIQVVLGPGEHCKRTRTSFQQDVGYMNRVSRFIDDRYSLCHIGEWRSHHNLSLNKPSAEDEHYVKRIFPQGMSKFLVIIANIKNGDTVKLSPYFFTDGGQQYEKAEYVVLESNSLFSTDDTVLTEIERGAEVSEYEQEIDAGNQQEVNTGSNPRRSGNTGKNRLQDTGESDLYPLRVYRTSSASQKNVTTYQQDTSVRGESDPEKDMIVDEEPQSERKVIFDQIHGHLKYWFGFQTESKFKYETSKSIPGADEITFKHNLKYWMVRFPKDFPTKQAKLFYSYWDSYNSYSKFSDHDLVKPLTNEESILLSIKKNCRVCKICKQITTESVVSSRKFF